MFLINGHAGFMSSTVLLLLLRQPRRRDDEDEEDDDINYCCAAIYYLSYRYDCYYTSCHCYCRCIEDVYHAVGVVISPVTPESS